jgi:hypothetical protein
MRWGGKFRIGEDTSDESLATDGGWGKFGCPPCDWYMDAMVQMGVKVHPNLTQGAPEGCPNCEVFSLFLGSNEHMTSLPTNGPHMLAAMKGKKKASFWMMWPSDWHADWTSQGYEAYVNRQMLFTSMRGLEAAGLRSSFPHPADLYEFITSKRWMATHCQDPNLRLPAATLVGRKEILRDPMKEAKSALQTLEGLRSNTAFAAVGGPSVVNRNGVRKGVVKLGWSWEAKHVWFWNGVEELSKSLHSMIQLDDCLAESCIVQEWVDFDFELRFFFFPPANWAEEPVELKPRHYEYTSWNTKSHSYSPGSFTKPKRFEVLKRWEEDSVALDAAHAQAEVAAQHLIKQLLQKSPVPVPIIRLDFMLKRTGPGQAQVAFGEYCENGCCVLQWAEGPPMVWRASLDYAMK